MATIRHNDAIAAVVAASKAAIGDQNKAENSTAGIAFFVQQLLNDERFGAVGPTGQWAKSPEAMKDVTARVTALCECAAEDITLAVSKERNITKKAQIRSEKRAIAALLKNAVQLLGAMATLEAVFCIGAEYRANAWHVPVCWYVPDGMRPLRPDSRVTFIRTRGAWQVSVRDVNAKDDDETTDEVVEISPSASSTIALAYGKAKREPKTADTKPAATEAASAQEEDGSAEANAPSKATTASFDYAKARRMLALEAGREDYRMRPNGEAAESWADMFSEMACNVYFRAMMAAALAEAGRLDDATKVA